jgi:hypothetical protein
MVTSDIRAINFEYYLDQKEKRLHTKPLSFEKQMEAYNSLGAEYQRLFQKPIKEIVELEEEIRLLTLQLRELK